MKSIVFKIQNAVCDINLQDDYIDCDEASFVDIDVLSNDGTLDSPIVTIGTNPTKGTVEINVDNTITYTVTTGVAEDTDFFTYIVTDGECVDTATVYITINSELTPLPNFTLVNLNKNTSADLACAISGSNAVTKYINTANFSSASALYNDIHGLYVAPVGYYTNGAISRYWSGSAFGATNSCS